MSNRGPENGWSLQPRRPTRFYGIQKPEILLGPLSDFCFRLFVPQCSVVLGVLIATAGGVGCYLAPGVTVLTVSYAIIGKFTHDQRVRTKNFDILKQIVSCSLWNIVVYQMISESSPFHRGRGLLVTFGAFGKFGYFCVVQIASKDGQPLID